jgi:DNA (cytosine-5)-methyltransferase 1
VYVRENKSNLCPTLTANMGAGGHNVPLIIDDFGIRKLSPKECLNFQGFPTDFNFPKDMAKSHCYMQAGNSVVVPVINRIAVNIKKALMGYKNVH